MIHSPASWKSIVPESSRELPQPQNLRWLPTVVQPEGKPRMVYDAWRNGARPGPGESLE